MDRNQKGRNKGGQRYGYIFGEGIKAGGEMAPVHS